MREADRPAGTILGGALAVVIGLALLLSGSRHPFAVLILALPMIGGMVALLWARKYIASLVALALIVTGAVFLLIGATGLLYIPSVVLLIYGMRAQSS